MVSNMLLLISTLLTLIQQVYALLVQLHATRHHPDRQLLLEIKAIYFSGPIRKNAQE